MNEFALKKGTTFKSIIEDQIQLHN